MRGFGGPLAVAWVVGCSANAPGLPGPQTLGGSSDDGSSDATGDPGDSSGAAATDDGTTTDTGGPPPIPPMPVEPCGPGVCWSQLTFSSICGVTAIDEDFASGAYNVHEFPLSVRGGIPFDLAVTRTDGTWSPHLVVHDETGTTIADGELGLVEPGLFVQVEETGLDSDTARIYVEADEDRDLVVYVTAWEAADADFMDFLPMDAAYEYRIETDCPTDLPLVAPPNFDPGNVVGGYFLLPDSDPPGLYERKPDDCSRGNQNLIEVIYTVAQRWAEIRGAYTPMLIRDLNAGSCSDVTHATHDDGTHVDIVLTCVTDVGCPDWIGAMDLAKLFVHTGEVCGIAFNDETVQSYVNPYFEAMHGFEPWFGTFMRTVPGHTEHMHVRVKKPDGTCN